jgi:hypothetical protein
VRFIGAPLPEVVEPGPGVNLSLAGFAVTGTGPNFSDCEAGGELLIRLLAI